MRRRIERGPDWHSDINSKDYRAWYGLGQAYEMLEMHYYALNYFQRAAALKYVFLDLLKFRKKLINF